MKLTDYLVTYLGRLANSRRSKRNAITGEVRYGLLRVYSSQSITPYNRADCVALDTLLIHLQACGARVGVEVTLSDLKNAIRAMWPERGTGARPHVIVKSSERWTADRQRARDLSKARKDTQNAEYFSYLTDRPADFDEADFAEVLGTIQ